jgi:hypothetical protein
MVLGLAVMALSSFVARAVPYASCITNNGTTVSFYLNEAADNVKVVYDGGGVGKTNDLGALAKGPQSFSFTGHTSYKIHVTKNAPAGWTMTSDDTNPMNMYGSPRGVVVSQVASNLSSFGRIYVTDSATPGATAGRLQDAATLHWRTNYGKGVYVLNADQSDCLGQATACNVTNTCVNAFSNGIAFGTPLNASSPYRIGFGQDNKLYINCFATVDATTWRSTNADCRGFEQVFAGIGEFANRVVHSDSSTKVIAEGSTEDGSLKLWMLDGNLTNSSGALILNRICQWDINGGPLPWNTPPTQVGTATAYSTVADVTCDLDKGLDGKWFVLVYRSAGTDRASIQQYDTDGATLLFDSFTYYGSPDPLRNAYVSALSPDGKTFAWATVTNKVLMFSLNSSGVIDPSTLTGFDQPGTPSVTGPNVGNARGICWDAAGNIYVVSSGFARLRTFSPGGFTVTTTGSDGTFALSKPANNVSVTATTSSTSMDLNQPPGVFTVTRTGDTGVALPVGYTLTGTATNGVQYQALSGTVTFLAGETSTNINVTAIPYSPAGPTRSVILTLNGSTSYTPVSPLTATVWIIDTNTPSIHVALKDTQFYERTNDLAGFTLTRWGDTNVNLFQINLAYGGSATAGTHFYGAATTNMIPGDENLNVYVYPIHDGVVTGPLTVTATVAPAGDGSYVVGTPATSGEVTRVDSDDPPETVIWSDNLQADTSANWTQFFATTNDAPYDATVTWAYDYSALLVPPAPHSGADTHGLFMTVNKNDTQLAAAALNFYPNGQSFSGNFALRFDMFLTVNNTSGTTEYNLFGINHSGTKTNWFRNTVTAFTGVDPVGWNFDGVFYAIESDGAHLGDYVAYSSPTTPGRNPTPLPAGPEVGGGRSAATLQGVFKTPPWTAGGDNGGAPANVYGGTSPIWADVELRQVNGVISWYINHTLIFAYTNTTPYKSGNIMLGYTDAYDSIGASGGSVIYANARVISLALNITSIKVVGSNVEIGFQATSERVPADFTLQQSSPLATGPYADTTSTISSLGGGKFKAVKAVGSSPTFYRIRGNY